MQQTGNINAYKTYAKILGFNKNVIIVLQLINYYLIYSIFSIDMDWLPIMTTPTISTA